MTKVVLLGDSIRQIGYGTVVPSLCENEFEIWQPKENCRFAQYTLRGMFEWKKEMQGADIIHWNNGLWDVCDLFGDGQFTPIDHYVEYMVRIAGILKGITPKVIFATTTPVHPDNPYNTNEMIRRFNEALVPKLQAMDVQINDLHALVSQDLLRYIRSDDRIHLTEEGKNLCADAVLKALRRARDEEK